MKAEYFRSVERTFLNIAGRGVAVSDVDRGLIERWFGDGIPFSIVEAAIKDACQERSTAVRSLKLADAAVEKRYRAWKAKNVGSERAVKSGYLDAFEQWQAVFDRFVEGMSDGPHIGLLVEAARDIRNSRHKTDDPQRLEEALYLAETKLYDSIWEKMAPADRADVEFKLKKLLPSSIGMRDEEYTVLREKLRNKKLRERLDLPKFTVSHGGGWA